METTWAWTSFTSTFHRTFRQYAVKQNTGFLKITNGRLRLRKNHVLLEVCPLEWINSNGNTLTNGNFQIWPLNTKKIPAWKIHLITALYRVCGAYRNSLNFMLAHIFDCSELEMWRFQDDFLQKSFNMDSFDRNHRRIEARTLCSFT